MSNRSLKLTEDKIKKLLANVGDMALKRRAKMIIGELELEDGNQVLEIGCGNGYYLSLLNRLGVGLDLTGIDRDERALKDARKFIGNNKVKLILANATKLPFPSNSFDRIIMSEVIEHVEDENATLSEAYRVLKTGGILSLTTCNIDYPFFWDPVNWTLQHLFKTHIKKGFWAGIWNQHDRMYNPEIISKLLKKTRFQIEKMEVLTGWCLPFNHYIVNFIAKLFYSNKLPKNLSQGMNKFQNNKQSIPVRTAFFVVNAWDSVNDLLPRDIGVSIYIKAKKA